MGEGLCGSSMFGSDRWGVNPMTAGEFYIFLNRYLLFIVEHRTLCLLVKCSYNKFLTFNMYFIQLKGFGQLNQSSSLSSSLNSGLNSSINISSAMGAGGYQHYGLNALGGSFFFKLN